MVVVRRGTENVNPVKTDQFSAPRIYAKINIHTERALLHSPYTAHPPNHHIHNGSELVSDDPSTYANNRFLDYGGGYSTTSYSAAGGAGGGGFLGGSQGGSQSNNAGKVCPTSFVLFCQYCPLYPFRLPSNPLLTKLHSQRAPTAKTPSVR